MPVGRCQKWCSGLRFIHDSALRQTPLTNVSTSTDPRNSNNNNNNNNNANHKKKPVAFFPSPPPQKKKHNTLSPFFKRRKRWPGHLQRRTIHASYEAMSKATSFAAIIEGFHHHSLGRFQSRKRGPTNSSTRGVGNKVGKSEENFTQIFYKSGCLKNTFYMLWNQKDPKYIPGFLLSRIRFLFSLCLGSNLYLPILMGVLWQRFLYLSGNLVLVTNLIQQQTSSENPWKNSST